MRFKKTFFVCLLLQLLTFEASSSAEPVFSHQNNLLTNSSTISLIDPNSNRPKSSTLIKFSIRGAYIETVDLYANSTLWRYELSDRTVLELYIRPQNEYTKQYYLIWYGGGPNEGREVCFHYGNEEGTYWYPTYHSSLNPEFPLNPQRNVPRFSLSYLNDPNVVRNEYFDAVEHLFVNTDGIGVIPEVDQPLFLRREPNGGDPLLCFSVYYVWPYNAPENLANDPSLLDIKVHLFQASTIRDAVDQVIHKSGLIKRPTSIPDEAMFRSPSWVSWNQPDEVMKYPKILRDHGYTSGEILVDESLVPGLNPTSAFDRLVEEIHSNGFRVKFAKLPIVDRTGNSITQYYFTRLQSSGIRTSWVDFSNEVAREWYLLLLRRLQLDNGVDAFAMMGTSETEAVMINNSQQYPQPSDRTVAHFELLAPLSTSSSAYQAFRTQHLPVFLQLTSSPTTIEQYLKSLIPSALALSIGGYSWLSPKPIGLPNPSEELYIRWIQAVAFLPHFAFYTHPWQYSARVNEITLKFVRLHQAYGDLYVDLAKERITKGTPIIRPLWYTEPFNPNTFLVNDQFMVGDKLVVAPILEAGKRSRTVFLPNGIWYDPNGNRYVGAGHFTVSAELEELLFFKKV